MEATQTTTNTQSETRPLYMFTKSMAAIKESTRIEDYAAEVTELRFSGESLRGVCPIHHGENRSSFAVYPDKQRWFCFRCDEGGDIVDLCQAVEKHTSLWTAMLSLAQRYSVGLPRRPEGWHKWQSKKSDMRAAILEAMTLSYQRRLFRVYAGFLSDIEDPVACKEEAASFWDTCYAVARTCAARRLGQ